MKERPILFSGSMVRAILDGRKTQTRRIMRHQPRFIESANIPHWRIDCDHMSVPFDPACESLLRSSLCHHFDGPAAPGGRLWVRESWQIFDPHPDGDGDALGVDRIKHGQRAPWDGVVNERAIEWVAAYRADGDVAHKTHGAALWRPSIHMPRWASRLTLDVTAVRVERLQAISEDDARAEGVREFPLQEGAPGAWWTADPSAGAAMHARDPVAAFRKLWDSINGDRASWDSNPWVWVVEFARAEVRK